MASIEKIYGLDCLSDYLESLRPFSDFLTPKKSQKKFLKKKLMQKFHIFINFSIECQTNFLTV